MRTLDEIKADIERAASINDATSLRALVEEMLALGTSAATAYAQGAHGSADRMTGAFASALEHYQRALTMFEELGDLVGVARMTGSMGHAYQAMGNFSLALEHFHRSIEQYAAMNDRAGVANSTNGMGTVYTSTGDYPSALECYRRTLAMYEELGNRIGVAVVMANIALVDMNTGDYPSAHEHFRRVLPVYEELGNRAGIANVTGNLGAVYAKTGDHQLALEYFTQALSMHTELGARASVAIVTANMGNLYYDAGDDQSALEYYRQALTQYEELGDHAGVAMVTGNIITALLRTGDHTAAADLLDHQQAMRMHDPLVRAAHADNRARHAEYQADLDAAHGHLTTALAIVTDAGARDAMAEYHGRLRELAQKRNDFAGYIEHNNEYNRLTEEIRGKEATQKLAMMEAKRRIEAELRERDKERALLYGALPESVATRMLRGEDVSGDHFDNASVLFLDIVGFTTISDRIPPGHVVHLLKAIFKVCDDVCTTHGLTKIKTIGDSYLAVAGVPGPQDDHATRAALAACEMMNGLNNLELTMDPKLGDTSWTKDVGEIAVRIGLHCGPLVAGIVGEQRLQYDVWGDTVNVASRMESTGEPGRIHVSEAFKESLTPCLPDSLTLIKRGLTDVKGKGPMTTYWLEGA